MIPDNNRRGYQFGSGVIDRVHQRFVVGIPKNASSFVLDWCTRSGEWHVHSLIDTAQHNSVQEVIVILRDPVERWLSGFAQYACSWLLNASRFFDTATGPGANFQRRNGADFVQHYNWLTERLIFDNLETFDDHVWPQTWFFHTLLPDVPRRYFLLDPDFDLRFQSYLHLPDPSADLDRNSGNQDSDMQQIQQFLRQRVDAVPELLNAIQTAYAQDYDMIESLQCR